MEPKTYSCLKTIGICLLFQFIGIHSFGQSPDPKFELIRGSNGITLGKINALTQDKYGFLWLSDQDNRAIIRYDGNHMQPYYFNPDFPDNPYSMGGYYPECLYADRAGDIWIGFFGQGVDHFDSSTQTFTHYRADPNDPASISNDYVSTILEDQHGNIWIGTNEGLDRLDPKTNQITHFKNKADDPTSLSHNTVRSLYEDQEGTVWVGTGFPYQNDNKGGLNRFDPGSQSFKRFMADKSDPNALWDNKIRAIFEDSKGNFWVGSRGDGLHILDRKSDQFTRFPIDPRNPKKLSRPPVIENFDHITFITEDHFGNIWIGTHSNGINVYNPESKEIIHYGQDQDDSGLYTGNSAWCIYRTDDDLLWLSTQSANFYKIEQNQKVFTQMGKQLYPSLPLADTAIWYGTEKGLVYEHLQSGNQQLYSPDPDDTTSLSNILVFALSSDQNGNIWIGTDLGLNKYLPNSNSFKQYLNNPLDSQSISGNSISFIHEDGQNNLWIGTNDGGLNILDLQTEKFWQFAWNPLDTTTLGSAEIPILHAADDGEIWVSSGPNSGIAKYIRSKHNFQRYLIGLSINSIHEDYANRIWVGTTNGLYTYNPTKDNFEFIPLGRDVQSILEDQHHNLWIGSAVGVFKYNMDNNQFVHFEKPVNTDFSIARYTNIGQSRILDERIFQLGSYFGYFEIIPSELPVFRDSARTYFTNFWIENDLIRPGTSKVLLNDLLHTEEIRLKSKQNVFSFSFTEVEFKKVKDNSVSFYLEGYDLEWRETTSGERVTYYKVPPGEYVLRIKASNLTSGSVSEDHIIIDIAQPWWNTWLAYLAYLILAGVLIRAIDRFQKSRILRIEREKNKDRELAQAKEIEKAYQQLQATQEQLVQQEKLASLGQLTAGIAHEIKNPLNFVNNFSEVSKELLEEMRDEIQKGDFKEANDIADDLEQNLEKIYHHGSRADSIVQSMLLHSRGGSGEKTPTDLNGLLKEYVNLAFHGMRARSNPINVKMDLNLDQSIGEINIIQEDFSRVILNMCNNAFDAMRSKLANSEQPYEPLLSISTHLKDQQVILEIQDNGPGIPAELKDKVLEPFFTTKKGTAGTGLGLSISNDIIKAHGGTLDIQSEKGKGSTFLITLENR